MTEEVLFGADALDSMEGKGQGDGAKFTSLKAGTTLKVKAARLSTEDGKFVPVLMKFFSYGIYKKIDSFVAKNPSKKSKKGYPVEDLTSWDLAWKFHKDKSEHYQDAQAAEAGKYRAKERYAIVFINLEDGKPAIIDLSKKQATAVYTTLKKYATKLDKMAFELTKSGESTNTVVTLSPIIDFEEDLSDKERKNFTDSTNILDSSVFEGLLYELDEDEMVEKLVQAGFNVRLIGLEPPVNPTQEGEAGEAGESAPNADPFSKEGPIEIADDDLPF